VTPRALFRSSALACALAALAPGAAFAVPGPDSVVIVANANIPESVGLAKYYAAQRKVPTRQICALDLPLPPYDPTPIPPGSVWYTKTDVLVASDFQNYVMGGLLTCLGARALERIEAAVVMRGVPIQVGLLLPNQPPPGISFAAALSLWKSTTLDGRPILGQDLKLGEPICEADQFNCVARWRAPYRNAPTVFDAGWTGVALTEDGVPFTGRPWLVTMLHGLSYGVDADGNLVPGQLGPARGLIDSALAGEAGPATGKFLFMRNPDDPGRSVLDWEYDGVIAKLAQRGFTNAEAVAHSTSLTGQSLASFFVGSVNLGPYDPGGGSSTIEGNTYAPGSLVDNVTSVGAAPLKFDPNCVCPPVGNCSCYHYPNQPSIARWVAKGVGGVHGTVHEPQSNVFPSRKLILDYVDGATLAEAFFRNLPYVYWKNLVLGDPMAAPYATRPVVTIEDAVTGLPIQEGEDVSGTRQVRVEASDPAGAGIASVRLLVGGFEVARASGDTLTACVGADTAGVQLLAVAQSNASGPLGPGNFKPKGWLDRHVDPGAGPAAAPCPPLMYKAVPGNGAATVSWDRPPNGGSAITGYTVTASPGGQTASAGAGAVSAVVSGLTNGTAYTFTVTAQNPAGTSAASAASNSVTPAALPGAPTGVGAAGGYASAVVNWSPPASNGGSPITSYTITTSPGGLTITADAGAASARVSGLTNGTAYTFTVKATTAAGTGAASAPAAATPANLPGAPGIGSATLGTGSAQVTWTAPGSDGGSPITGYRVEAIRLIENVAGDGTTDVLAYPDGVAVDSSGAVYIADTGYGLVRKLSGGTLTVVAGGGTGGLGDGGPATSAELSAPTRLALDGSGLLFISDTGHQRVRKVDLSSGVISTVAGNGEPGFAGDGGPGASAQLDTPAGLAAGGGSLYIADKENHRVRRVDLSSGTISTAAGDGTPGFAGDGGPATAARLWYPEDVALDGALLYVADGGNGRVRRVSAGGTITTVAGGGTKPLGDGGTALESELVVPSGIALDAAHTLYISEGLKSRIRQVDAAGTITTAAGNGTHGGEGDGGSAALAQLRYPRGLAVDAAGKLHVADAYNHRIRAVASDAPFATAGAGATAADVTGLRPSTTYTFAVRAQSAIGLSAPSAASNAVTTPGVPGAPTNIVAMVLGTGEVKVTWTPPASDGGSPITGYVITSAPDGISVTVGPAATEAIVSGLTVGQSYTFTVIATNAYGPGASSDPSNPVVAGSSIPALGPPALAFFAIALAAFGARALSRSRARMRR
jgi:sugar lactone lactonase YvrE